MYTLKKIEEPGDEATLLPVCSNSITFFPNSECHYISNDVIILVEAELWPY